MRISLLATFAGLVCVSLCSHVHLGSEYEHFASKSSISGEDFLSLTDGFFSSWHSLDLSGSNQLKSAHLEAIRSGIDGRISAIPDIERVSVDTPEFKLLQSRVSIANSNEGIRNFNHFASKQGLSGVFGRSLDNQELLSAFQTHLLAHPEYYSSDLKAELDGKNQHLAAETTDHFFGGETQLDALKHFLAFSLAHLEQNNDEYSHLALGLSDDRGYVIASLKNALTYINNAGLESDWDTIEHHLFGVTNPEGDRLEPPIGLGFYHALSVQALDGGFEKNHLLFGKRTDDEIDEDSPFFRAATEKYKPQAGVIVQPITVDFSNLVLDLNDASREYKLPGINIAA